MKTVALTVAAPSLDEEVEARFGRAEYILLVDPGNLSWDSMANPGKDDGSGAGIRVAQLLSDRNVTDVICREFGPKASEALGLAGIRPHRCGSNIPAREAVALFNSGNLDALGTARERPGERPGEEPGEMPNEGLDESGGRGRGGGRGGRGGRGQGRGRGNRGQGR